MRHFYLHRFMSFQTPITTAEAIDNIEANSNLLPAIRRMFVWPSEKIQWLFDSLVRGYPISSLLIWSVESGSGLSHPTEGNSKESHTA